MFARTGDFEVNYIPSEGVDPDDAVQLGAAWLEEQPGSKLVLLGAKNMYGNNPLLPQLTSFAHLATPQDVWKSNWDSGAVPAPWPSEKVLATLSDDISYKVKSVCVLESGYRTHQKVWLSEKRAINILTGEPYGNDGATLHPVVVIAMQHLSAAVNHNNGLVTGYEKYYAVRTLQELVRAGYSFDADELCAWSLANGFSGREVASLRKYAPQALQGRRFILKEEVGPGPGAAQQWEEEAQAQGSSLEQ